MFTTCHNRKSAEREETEFHDVGAEKETAEGPNEDELKEHHKVSEKNVYQGKQGSNLYGKLIYC